MTDLETILILVKTYPTFSKKYFELVCTAGVNQNGEWRRIYPIQFRSLPELERYKKYQSVRVKVERNHSDPRPESYKLIGEIEILGEPLSAANAWRERKRALFDKTKIYYALSEIIDAARDNKMSLAIFKPKRFLDFKIEPADREWDKSVLNQIKIQKQQLALSDALRREVKLIKKLPYKFSYRFEDAAGKQATLMIEDWEIGQLYWNCLERAADENSALAAVRQKYGNDFIENKDLYLFLGTTREFHLRARNPYLIVGVFYPPKTDQSEMM